MEVFETPIFDDDILKLVVRLTFNLVFVLLLVLVAYYPNQKRRNYVFMLLMMNISVFFICFSMKKLDLGLGMALGLFAIFAILRFRTDAIRIKDMTYLFVVVGIAVVNALSNKTTSYLELVFVNLALFFAAFILERALPNNRMDNQTLVYDKLELLKPENESALLEDLSQRTGLPVQRVEVKKYDFVKQSGIISIYYSNGE